MPIYDHQDFWLPLSADIQNARGSVKIHVPYITQSALERWSALISDGTSKGVAFCVVLQKPRDWEKLALGALTVDAAAKMDQFGGLLKWMEALGAHVQLRERIHAKLIVIDEDILWEGSLNFLSHFDTTEHVRKSINRHEVLEVKKRHKLDECDKCKSVCQGHDLRLQELVVLRRKSLGMNQGDLAKAVQIGQSQVCKLESGNIQLVHRLFLRTLQALKLRIVLVPEHLCPPVEHFVQTAMREAAESKRRNDGRQTAGPGKARKN